jgi:hypothetical protein
MLHAIAICVLLAAATVWAAPPGLIPQTARSQKAASTAQKPALPGSLGEPAESRLKALSALPGSRAERREPTFKTLEPTAALKQRAGLEQLLKEVPNPQLKPLSKILLHKTGFLGYSVVPGAVKQFSTDFAEGAKDPARYMSELSLSQPALVKKWKETPRDKRTFVIGAGKDSAKVSEWAKSMESDGYIVFFYKFCQSSGALCSSRAVGAMCGTSTTTMVYQTPAARAQ